MIPLLNLSMRSETIRFVELNSGLGLYSTFQSTVSQEFHRNICSPCASVAGVAAQIDSTECGNRDDVGVTSCRSSAWAG